MALTLTAMRSSREQRAWYWYDWANSGYVTTTGTVLFGPYLTSVAKDAAGCTDDPCTSTLSVLGIPVAPGSLFFYAVTFATLFSAVLLQICIAVNRIVVMKSVADEFVGELAAIVDALHVGDPIEPDVVMGPTTTAAVLEKTQQHVADARCSPHRGAPNRSVRSDPPGHHHPVTALRRAGSDAQAAFPLRR